ncbi:MAG: SDR family NAD(P)-dependent oxidoreductase [Halioglobus sp.]
MTVLHETVEVSRPLGEVFDYVSDFTTTREWDATAKSAVQLTEGPVDIGTRFAVVCALPVGSIKIIYTVAAIKLNEYVELHGSCRFFNMVDRITFSETQKGTLIDYRATFSFKPGVKTLASAARSGLEKMGRESVSGLGIALEDHFSVIDKSDNPAIADRLVLPGLSRFTRLGYQAASKNFLPMSASIKGRHIVVTGATAGLGYVAALELARRGARLTLVARNEDKVRVVRDDIIAATANTDIHYEVADLAVIADVDDLIVRLRDKGDAIDVLVNNAGALFNPRQETSEGLESSYALLLLSPYRLTEGLKPLLAKAGSARVINVVSGGMYSQKLDVAALPGEDDDKNYSGSVAYARAKRALMVVTEEWAKSWAEDGIVVNAMHPGWADTPGVKSALPEFRKLTQHVLRSSEEGADTIIWLAVASEARRVSGKLFLDRVARPTHILKKTREEQGQRTLLMEHLQQVS